MPYLKSLIVVAMVVLITGSFLLIGLLMIGDKHFMIGVAGIFMGGAAGRSTISIIGEIRDFVKLKKGLSDGKNRGSTHCL